jgi:hypothetical protein
MASKKKPRKQKLKTLKQQPAGLPTYEIKISEAILKLSDSLRKKYRELHRLQGIIVIDGLEYFTFYERGTGKCSEDVA